MRYCEASLWDKPWGEASVGAASELAGLDRFEFLEFCKREGVILRAQTPDELETDVRKFGGVE